MTGTDEHGSKIQQAAQKVNSPPQDYCDMISEQFKELFQQFDINFTHFIRTTDESHVNAVHKFWVSIQLSYSDMTKTVGPNYILEDNFIY